MWRPQLANEKGNTLVTDCEERVQHVSAFQHFSDCGCKFGMLHCIIIKIINIIALIVLAKSRIDP